jgi:branched-chain amino acid transport system permease protein
MKRFFGHFQAIFAAILLLSVLLLPLFGLTPNIIRILFITFVWTTASLAWNLLGGLAGQVSFGFAVFYGLGAYTAALLINSGVNPALSFAGSGAVSALASFLIGIPTFRLRGPYFAIATIGVSEAVRVVMNNISAVGGAGGLRVTERGIFHQTEHYYAGLAIAVLAIFVSLIVKNSKFGLALRAIRQDEDAAADVGINPFRCKLWIHAIAAALTGIAGGVFADYAAYVHPQGVFAFSTSVTILLMPVIGGIGTIWGAVLGAAVVTIVEEQLVAIFPEIHLLLYGLLLMLIVLLEPDGLVGLLRRLLRRMHVHPSSREPDEALWGRGRLEGRQL